jgi:hypothetical protein
MYRDADFEWDEGFFPYDVLAAADVTPDSSMNEVVNAVRVIAGNRKSNANLRRKANQAQNKLQSSQERLRIDFFLYRMDYGFTEEGENGE